jgi:hypothetical protein
VGLLIERVEVMEGDLREGEVGVIDGETIGSLVSARRCERREGNRGFVVVGVCVGVAIAVVVADAVVDTGF